MFFRLKCSNDFKFIVTDDGQTREVMIIRVQKSTMSIVSFFFLYDKEFHKKCGLLEFMLNDFLKRKNNNKNSRKGTLKSFSCGLGKFSSKQLFFFQSQRVFMIWYLN